MTAGWTSAKAFAMALCFGSAVVALSPEIRASEPPNIFQCYSGTFTGFRSGRVHEFIFSGDTLTDGFWFGYGYETDGPFVIFDGRGDKGYSYTMTNGYFSGVGSVVGDDFGVLYVLVGGKANATGDKVKFKLVSQRLQKFKLRLTPAPSTPITVTPDMPTVLRPLQGQEGDDQHSVVLTASVAGIENQAVTWRVQGANTGTISPVYDSDGTIIENKGRYSPYNDTPPGDVQILVTSFYNPCESTMITVHVTTCGNNFVEPGAGESCDLGDLNGQDCTSQGFTGGTLACRSDCTFDTSGCTP